MLSHCAEKLFGEFASMSYFLCVFHVHTCIGPVRNSDFIPKQFHLWGIYLWGWVYCLAWRPTCFPQRGMLNRSSKAPPRRITSTSMHVFFWGFLCLVGVGTPHVLQTLKSVLSHKVILPAVCRQWVSLSQIFRFLGHFLLTHLWFVLKWFFFSHKFEPL